MIHWILELFGVRRRDWRCRDRAYRAGRNSGRRWWHPGTRKRVIRGPTLSSGGWRVASALPVRANTCTAPRRTVATPKIFDLELIAGDHNAILLFPWPSLLWTLNFELWTFDSWSDILRHLEESHRETQEKLGKMQTVIQSLMSQQQQRSTKSGRLASRDLYLMVLVLALSHIVIWLYWKK